jgi:hypothetical protein
VQEQGDKVRKLKEAKAPAGDVDKEVKELLALKKELQELTGENLLGGGRQQKAKAPAKPAPQKAAPKKEEDVGLLILFEFCTKCPSQKGKAKHLYRAQ